MSFLHKQIDWDKNSLIPAIAQDYLSQEVLMLAYMNKEALDLTIDTKIAHYFSRSKNRIWKKGEISGHTQEIKSIKLDCDKDTILLSIKQNGVACHTGEVSCFFNDITNNKVLSSDKKKDIDDIYGAIDKLYDTIQSKKMSDANTSYTAQLFSKGENTILKKVVEESGELCFAIKDNNKQEIINEASDLLYHTLVALSYRNISPDLIRNEIKNRFGISGIEEKNSRKTR